jgi:hypothetical protein
MLLRSRHMSKRYFTTSKLSVERLREVLDYNPQTGVFTWKVNLGRRARSGNVAGGVCSKGYLAIRLDGVLHKAHRLAMYFSDGAPCVSEHIDHIDRDKLNNRLCNLRKLSCSENLQNAKINSKNKSGAKGVNWSEANGKWQARITLHRERIRLGFFNNIADAIAARKAAEIKYHPFRVTSESL